MIRALHLAATVDAGAMAYPTHPPKSVSGGRIYNTMQIPESWFQVHEGLSRNKYRYRCPCGADRYARMEVPTVGSRAFLNLNHSSPPSMISIEWSCIVTLPSGPHSH